MRGHRLVERGVEHATCGTSEKTCFAARMPSRFAGLCQRRERGQVLDLLLDVRGDDGRGVEGCAAVHDAVTTTPPAGARRTRGRPCRTRRASPETRRRGSGTDAASFDEDSPRDRIRVLPRARGLTDAFDESRGERALVVELDDRYLNEHDPEFTTRAAVTDGSLSVGLEARGAVDVSAHADGVVARSGGLRRVPAWMAVIATVLTMSLTSAPRDRSLIGLRMPWSTGPIANCAAERCTALYVCFPVLRSGR